MIPWRLSGADCWRFELLCGEIWAQKKGPRAPVERYSDWTSSGFSGPILAQICNRPFVDLWLECLLLRSNYSSWACTILCDLDCVGDLAKGFWGWLASRCKKACWGNFLSILEGLQRLFSCRTNFPASGRAHRNWGWFWEVGTRPKFFWVFMGIWMRDPG